MFWKRFLVTISLFVLFLSGCSAVQERSDNKMSLSNNYADKFIESEFQAFLQKNSINDYFITETLRGSDQFEKAYRFIDDKGSVMSWGCKIRLNSFTKTGNRSSEMLDFEVLEEGAAFAEQLFSQEELLRSDAGKSSPASYRDGYAVVTLPSGWSWIAVGEYFRTHKETVALTENTDLTEYIKSYWTDTLNDSLPHEASADMPVLDCQVNDDFSVSLRVMPEIPDHFLENNQVNLTELVSTHEETNTDGIYKIEYSADLREMNIFIDRSYMENKLQKSGKHGVYESQFMPLMIRHQVWKGVIPENLYAEISIKDKDTGELISREALTGNLWLEE